MRAAKQTTLRNPAVVHGIGVHSGEAATLTLLPAPANTGIVFLRAGQNGEADRELRADFSAVTATEFATVLGDAQGPLCSTSEHILAALAGLGVDNVVIEIDGAEVPIMDGSASAFVEAIEVAGIVTLAAPRRFIKILKPVRVTQGDAYGELRPHSSGFRLEIDIDFDHPLIGHQQCALDLEPETFKRELSRARTFGFMRDVNKLWEAGYARGASLENTLVIDEDRVLNADGVRFADEFARHKALDAVGDLALAGKPLLGLYRSRRGGHRLNHAVLTALMADRSAWAVVEASEVRRRAAPRGAASWRSRPCRRRYEHRAGRAGVRSRGFLSVGRLPQCGERPQSRPIVRLRVAQPFVLKYFGRRGFGSGRFAHTCCRVV